MQQIKSALPAVEHHILVLLIGAAIGSYFTLAVANHESAKTQAAVHDALKAVPVAQVEPTKGSGHRTACV